MLPRDQLSLTPVARTAPAAPVLGVADPRQQAFQRALAGMLGQSMQAEVLSRLPDGSFLVRVAEMAARMPLPPGSQPGSQLPLTLVALEPRPTFQLQTLQGGRAFAEAGPALAQGAPSPATSATPLAYLEGKEAAALARGAALLAGGAAPVLQDAGADGARASISSAGKALGEVIAAAQKAPPRAAAVLAAAPLLGAPSQDAGRIAGALQDGLAKSGLFYESHVAEWAKGARTLGELAAEPQARGMGPASDPATAQLIDLQLNAHEQGRVAWQGQLWPGQPLQWEVGREADGDEREARDGADGADGGRGGTWQSRLRLRLGALGELSARVVLAGDQLHIRVDAGSEQARARLAAGRARLERALAAAGTPLSTLAIHGAAAAASKDGAKDGDGPGQQ